MINTLMVNLILGRPNAHVLDAAIRIAAKFDAGVIGFAASRPIQTVCHDFAVPAVLFDEDRKEIERHVKAGELEFRHAVAHLKGQIEWRAHTTVVPLAEYLSRQARNADLVVVGTEPCDGQCDATRRPDLCDFVMSVGRPVLVVPGRGGNERPGSCRGRLEGHARSAEDDRRCLAVSEGRHEDHDRRDCRRRGAP